MGSDKLATSTVACRISEPSTGLPQILLKTSSSSKMQRSKVDYWCFLSKYCIILEKLEKTLVWERIYSCGLFSWQDQKLRRVTTLNFLPAFLFLFLFLFLFPGTLKRHAWKWSQVLCFWHYWSVFCCTHTHTKTHKDIFQTYLTESISAIYVYIYNICRASARTHFCITLILSDVSTCRDWIQVVLSSACKTPKQKLHKLLQQCSMYNPFTWIFLGPQISRLYLSWESLKNPRREFLEILPTSSRTQRTQW